MTMYVVKYGMFKWSDDNSTRIMQPGKKRGFDEFTSALVYFIKKDNDPMCDWVTLTLDKSAS